MYKIIFLTPCKKPSACRGIPSTLDSVNKLGSETAGSATSNTARKPTLPSLSTSGAPPLAGDNVAPKTESQRLKMTNEEFKQVLGLENMRKQVYLDFRSAIQFFMSENEVVSRRQAGEEKWGVVKDWVLCHSHLKQVRQRLREESIDWPSVEQAIHFFCFSCSKSLGTSRRVSENTVGDMSCKRHMNDIRSRSCSTHKTTYLCCVVWRGFEWSGWLERPCAPAGEGRRVCRWC